MSLARGLIIAGAASHSGKTTIALGLIAALKARGMDVAAAKCGPDYIDPKFLEAASGRPAINLDPWAMLPPNVACRLRRQAEGADFIVVEGAMGLYDGGAGGSGSTASLAAIIGLPVVLVVSAAHLAQTTAAIAEGCARLADRFKIVGAIVNQVASDRHAALIREGFRRSTVPLLGLVRRDATIALPSRHLGLVQAEEHADLARKIARAAELVEAGCDVEGIMKVASAPSPPLNSGLPELSTLEQKSGKPDFWRGRDGEGGKTLPQPSLSSPLAGHGLHPSPLPDPPPQGGREGASPQGGGGLAPLGQRIAVARDLAFAFSYPHLLADWRGQGAEISFFSPLADEAPSGDADAIFLPGGYPELHAGKIAAASHFRTGMSVAEKRGALIYGECGGYMVLGDNLTDAKGAAHRMLGLLPISTSFAHPKLHLGYRRLRAIDACPWPGPVSAHEFHFASVLDEETGERLFDAEDVSGASLGPIGLRRGRVMGSFAHVIDAAC